MRRQIGFGIVLLCLGGLLAACGQADARVEEAATEAGLLASAAAEATAIVQRAQATALVLQAQAEATALVEQADRVAGTPAPTVALPLVPSPASPGTTPAALVGATPEEVATETDPSGEGLTTVEVLGVGFAADGGMIIVRFLASPDEAEKWWQGSVSVTDEGNGAVYNEIPVMPTIGPLIGRPKIDGQPGYVMLVNPPPGVQAGALVTVMLGAYTFEHIPVQ